MSELARRVAEAVWAIKGCSPSRLEFELLIERVLDRKVRRIWIDLPAPGFSNGETLEECGHHEHLFVYPLSQDCLLFYIDWPNYPLITRCGVIEVDELGRCPLRFRFVSELLGHHTNYGESLFMRPKPKEDGSYEVVIEPVRDSYAYCRLRPQDLQLITSKLQ